MDTLRILELIAKEAQRDKALEAAERVLEHLHGIYALSPTVRLQMHEALTLIKEARND